MSSEATGASAADRLAWLCGEMIRRLEERRDGDLRGLLGVAREAQYLSEELGLPNPPIRFCSGERGSREDPAFIHHPEWLYVFRVQLYDPFDGPCGAMPAVVGAIESVDEPGQPRMREWKPESLAPLREQAKQTFERWQRALAGLKQAEPTSESPAQNGVTPPSDKAIKAWRLHKMLGIKQKDVGETLGAAQYQVSRWVKAVQSYVEAGNILPPLPEPVRRETGIDPAAIDMGERVDGRTRRQRGHRSEDDRHAEE